MKLANIVITKVSVRAASFYAASLSSQLDVNSQPFSLPPTINSAQTEARSIVCRVMSFILYSLVSFVGGKAMLPEQWKKEAYTCITKCCLIKLH